MRTQAISFGVRGPPPQTVAMEVDPSEAKTSELSRTLKGKASSLGSRATRAFSAKVPASTHQPPQESERKLSTL